MRSGYILAICLTLFGAIDYWAEYQFFRHTDNDEYAWIMYLNFLFQPPVIGLCFHKRWARTTFRIILWVWTIAVFYTGIVASDLAGARDLFSGMIGSIKLHWFQFLLFGGAIFFSNSDKVKKDFGLLKEENEAVENLPQ